ncbi:hypothetical protein LJB42_000273 [Komagataella kurtzmanii]|nr:hypothetical protein LJB42_000273 [Komagataella kurtzmanii]
MDPQQSNKSHRGAAKKDGHKKKLHTQGYNAKAFAVSAPGKLQKMAMRSSEMNEKRLHVPMVNRTPDDDPPPVIIAVVGPPGTGKSTLIRSLVKRLSKTTMTDITGPVTLVSGKRRRVTFIEISNDMNSMIDIAKVADLVLLMVDGNFGLEMETMEFLNIAQHHGMPRVIGIATHLDLFKSQSTLRTSKKKLKHRFWSEVYPGAKLFYLSGVLNGRYPDRETLNLTRFISVMKFRPLKWRNEHPYLMVDRMIDLTHPREIEKNRKIDRTVALYGYLHGTPLQPTNARVHIPGAGDFAVAAVEKLPDPCPTPYYEQKLDEIEREAVKEAAANGETVLPRRRGRKRLEDKQKIIYAPMSDVHGVLIDRDAVYIDMGNQESFKKGEESGLGEQLVTDLQSVDKDFQDQLNGAAGVQLFSSSTALEKVENQENEEEDEDDISEDEEEFDPKSKSNTGRSQLRKPRVYKSANSEEEGLDLDNIDEDAYDPKVYDQDNENGTFEFEFDKNYLQDDEKLEFASDSELEDNEDWQGMASKLTGSVQRKWDINKLIYLNNIDPADVIARWKSEEAELDNEDSSEADIEQEEAFFQKKDVQGSSEDLDTSQLKFAPLDELKSKWVKPDPLDTLKKRFFKSPKQKISEQNKNGDIDDDEDEVYGDFEDLEAENTNNEDENESKEVNGSVNGDDFADFEAEEEKDEDDEDSSEEESEVEGTEELTLEEKRQLNAKKKEKLRQQFEDEEGENFLEEGQEDHDTWYEFQKAKMAKQLEINKSELEELDEQTRLHIEGYRAGSYVKLTFKNVPMEFVENFNPIYPVIVGGLLQTEEKFGYLNVRIRRHRWHKKILKTNDPLVLSLGWRRFQTLPIYTTTDSRTRTRMLKYTPEHAYCGATFYGPLVAPNTTFCGVQVVSNSATTGSFRIAATGVVEDLNADVEIVKKLKLVGYPYKVFKNTAFIKDMFSSALEVAKFEGASIKTVSGIRGEIKRALSKPDGYFRAAFEDKIQMSDIVFLRTWYPVQAKKFYNPVTSLLLKDKTEWKGMRLTGQVRHENNVPVPASKNSAYKKIEREELEFMPVKIPKALQAELPFADQIPVPRPKKQDDLVNVTRKRAVILDDEEKKAVALLEKISTLKKAKEAKNAEKKRTKYEEKLKKLAKEEEIKSDKDKQRKKDFFSKEGKKRSLGGESHSGARNGGKKRRN